MASDRVKICSLTMCQGPIEILRGALLSALPMVDGCVVCDTSGCDNDWSELERLADGKLTVARIDPIRRMDDVRGARNTALKVAAAAGFDWAIVLDSDERLHLEDGVDLHEALAATPHNRLLVWSALGVYPKDKIFRLPITGQWVRSVHETYHDDSGATRGELEGLTFSELERKPEQAHVRLLAIRDELRSGLRVSWWEHARVRLFHVAGALLMALVHLTLWPWLERQAKALAGTQLSTMTADKARDWYYLGDALASLGQNAEALRCFTVAGNLSRWSEEAAWSFFRGGIVLAMEGRFEDAYSLALMAWGRNPGFGDTAWLAAQVSLDAGRVDDAIWWAMVAVQFGTYCGLSKQVQRSIFCSPPGLWEGPFEVLAEAWARKGDEQRAHAYARKANAAETARLARTHTPQVRP